MLFVDENGERQIHIVIRSKSSDKECGPKWSSSRVYSYFTIAICYAIKKNIYYIKI